MCENGEVRWIAVKGLGIDRDSDRLIEIKVDIFIKSYNKWPIYKNFGVN